MGRSLIKFVGPLGLGFLPLLLYAAPSRSTFHDIQSLLGLPYSIAKVSDGRLADDGRIPDVILIQDIHRHPEVQGHIAAIVLYASHHWNVADVYVEGAAASEIVPPPTTSDSKTLVNEMENGRISGAELALGLEPGTGISLYGLENSELYRKNVAAYEQVQELQSTAMDEAQTAVLLRNSLDISGRDSVDTASMDKLLPLRLKPSERAATFDHASAWADGPALKAAVRAANLFYDLADARTNFFLNVLAERRSFKPCIVIVGGYHTVEMAREFRRLGRSYAVLTPHVTESGYDDLYAKGMQETISALKIR